MTTKTLDIITPEEAGCLYGLFLKRVRRSPEAVAYRYFGKARRWKEVTWSEMGVEVARWSAALEGEGLKRGDRVAIWLGNCKEWVMADLAALSLGLVVVPIFSNDRPENASYILNDSAAKMLFIENEEQWQGLVDSGGPPESIKHAVVVGAMSKGPGDLLVASSDWLPAKAGLIDPRATADRLATIVYTSGTTGDPKGVMLSHGNILWNAHSSIDIIPVYTEDLFLSFLPLSHTFERTAGYYLPIMTGTPVVYSRSIAKLAEDMAEQSPTIIISVPRLFEKTFSKIQSQLSRKSPIIRALFGWTIRAGWKRFEYDQGRGGWSPAFIILPLLQSIFTSKIKERLGGRLRLAISGGAALSPEIARFFIGAGIPISQGYGMTEASPVISVNPESPNIPESAGVPLDGVEVKIGDDDEIMVRSPGVMGGYWNKGEATAKTVNLQGWLHTGDKGRMEEGHIFISGRIKEIIVLSNGEKVPPADLETAITLDPAIEQALIVGEGRPFLSALVVLTKKEISTLSEELDAKADDRGIVTGKDVERRILAKISGKLSSFPGYEVVKKVVVLASPWTVESGLLTPTLKPKRAKILEQYKDAVDEMYSDLSD